MPNSHLKSSSDDLKNPNNDLINSNSVQKSPNSTLKCSNFDQKRRNTGQNRTIESKFEPRKPKLRSDQEGENSSQISFKL